MVCISVALLMPGNARADDHPAKKNLRLDIGFTHWASDTFRKSQDGRDLSFGFGYRLPLHWLEIQGRYEWAHIMASASAADSTDVDGKRVDFITAGFAINPGDFVQGGQRIILTYTLSALLVTVDGEGSKTGVAAGPHIEWLIDARQGIYCDLRKQQYELPDSVTTDTQTDLTVAMGYVFRL